MKKIYILLILFTIITNMYLIFKWKPSLNDIAVNSYDNVDNTNIDKDNILDELSFYFNPKEGIETLQQSDIEQVNNILRHLSTSDLYKWIELKNYKDNEKVIEFFKLIKKRMTSNDYEKIKNIVSKVIDVNRVELQLKNNYV